MVVARDIRVTDEAISWLTLFQNNGDRAYGPRLIRLPSLYFAFSRFPKRYNKGGVEVFSFVNSRKLQRDPK